MLYKISFLLVIVSALGLPMQAQSDSLVIDRDGNKYPVKALLDGNLWMTGNLAVNVPQSWCYDNSAEKCSQYGRLYTFEAAEQACPLLGEGWRLPTSSEWGRLPGLYGNGEKDSLAMRKAAYKSLLYPGPSGFNAVLGGNRDPDGTYARGNAHGFYWTATSQDADNAWYYNFAKGSQALYTQDGGEKVRAFSVRCVKGLQSPSY